MFATLLVLLGCGESYLGEKPADETPADSAEDTGVPTDDTAPPIDTGTEPVDTGEQVETGDTSEPVDTGTEPTDTGTSPVDDTGELDTDTGSADTDTGTEPVETGDTGTEPVDTAEPVDTGTSPVDDTGEFDTGTDPADTDTDSGIDSDTETGDTGTPVDTDTGTEPVETAEPETDDDADGVSVEDGDCDDSDASVYPGASEICNSFDDDCDGVVNDGVPVVAIYADTDGDGYGDSSVTSTQCATTSTDTGWSFDGTDCDDADVTVNPGERETCDDGIDQDCNGVVDSEYLVTAARMYWIDEDGDGYGEGGSATASTIPCGYVTQSGDCDGSDASVNSGAEEVLGDGIDQDCDGSDLTVLAAAQEEAECEDGAAACFVDADEDGNYETLLMDDSQWTSSSLYGDDAEIYADLDTCGINGDTVSTNDAGYYVVDFDAVASSCTARVSLVIGTSWWQNYSFCAYDDADGICVNTGGYNYLIEVDWNASTGLSF